MMKSSADRKTEKRTGYQRPLAGVPFTSGNPGRRANAGRTICRPSVQHSRNAGAYEKSRRCRRSSAWPRAELAKWAEDQGKGDAFHQAAFRAYFADGKNIAKMENLLDMAVCVSLDTDEARRIVEDRSYREAVDADWQRAYRLGITAVPTFLYGAGRLVGAQSYETLKQFVGQWT